MVPAGPVGANGAPSAVGIGSIYGIDVGSPAVVDLATAFSDPDTDELTYSLVANTDAAFVATAIDNTLDQLTVTRTAGAVGSAVVTIRASDGSSATQASFRVTDADHVWTGLGSNSNWNNGDNWVPRGIPWSEDVALLDSGSKDVLVTTSSLTVNGLRVTDGYTGTIDLNGKNVTAFADLDLPGASLDAAGAIVTVHGDLDLRGATVDASNATMKCKGDVDLGGAAVVATASSVELLGTQPVKVSGPGTPIGKLTIDTAHGITLDSDVTVGGLLTLESLVSLNGATLRAAGNVVAKDTNYAGSSTLELMGAGSQTVSATTSSAALVNTRIDKPSGTATFAGIFGLRGSFVHTRGTVDLSGTQVRFSAGMTQISAPGLHFDDVELASNFSSPVVGDLEIDGDLTIGSVAGGGASGTGFMNVRGNVTSTDAVVDSDVGVRFVGSANQTISAPDTDLTDGDLIIDKPTGSVTLATGLSVQGSTQQFRVLSGVFDANGHTLSVGNGVVVDGGTLTGVTSIDRQGVGAALTVTSGTVHLAPAEVASVAIGGDLVIGAEDAVLEVDLTNTGVGNHPNLLLAAGGRSGEFGQVVATNNADGYLVTPLYGATNAGIGLAVPNDAPTIAAGLPDRFGLTSSFAVSLLGAFEDADDDELSYSLTANSTPGFVTASVTGSQLLLTPVPGHVGSSQITVRATDPAGEWVEATFRVTDADHVWTGAAATGAWGNPQNWLPQEVPGPTDVAVIDSGSTNITINDDSVVWSLRIEPGFGGTVAIAATTNLTVVGRLSHRSGTIDMTGTSLTVGGESRFLADAVLTANSLLVVRSGASLELAGIEWNDVELQRQGLIDSISIDADLLIGGNLTVTGEVGVVGSSLRLVGGDDQLVSAGAGFLGTEGRSLVIEKPTGTVSLGTALDVHDLTLVSGTLDLRGKALHASGSLDLSGGPVAADGSTIELIDDGTARSVMFHGPSTSINDLRVDSANTITLAADVEVGGALTLAAVERLDGSTLRAGGDVHTGDIDYRGTTTLAFVADGDQQVTAESSQSSLRNVRIEKPSGTVGFEDSLQVQGGFVHIAGGVTFAGLSTVDQTVLFTGSSQSIDAAGVTFDNVTFAGDFAGSITGELRVDGEFSISQMTGPTTAGPGGEIAAFGNVSSTDALVDSLVPIRLGGGADQIVSGEDLTDADLIIDKPAGRVLLNDGLYLDGPGQAIIVAAGTLDTGGNTIEVDGGVWVDDGALQGGGSIRGQAGLTLSGGALSIDPDDPTTHFAVDGPIVLGGALRLDLTGLSAGSYLDMVTSEGSRIGTFATTEVSNNGAGLVVNERYGTNRAGVALGDPIVGQPDDRSIELPATATSVDLAAAFGRTDLTFVVSSDQSFVSATLDPATPGVLDLTFATGTIGTAEITVEVSSVDSGTETVRFDVTLVDSTDPADLRRRAAPRRLLRPRCGHLGGLRMRRPGGDRDRELRRSSRWLADLVGSDCQDLRAGRSRTGHHVDGCRWQHRNQHPLVHGARSPDRRPGHTRARTPGSVDDDRPCRCVRRVGPDLSGDLRPVVRVADREWRRARTRVLASNHGSGDGDDRCPQPERCQRGRGLHGEAHRHRSARHRLRGANRKRSIRAQRHGADRVFLRCRRRHPDRPLYGQGRGSDG